MNMVGRQLFKPSPTNIQTDGEIFSVDHKIRLERRRRFSVELQASKYMDMADVSFGFGLA